MNPVVWRAALRFLGWSLAYLLTFLVVGWLLLHTAWFSRHRSAEPLWVTALIVSAAGAALRALTYWQSNREAEPPSILRGTYTGQRP